MSLTIIKAGVLDTIQDTGRYGFQGVGINPGGAMDRFSACLANCLLGKSLEQPLIEMHFPAATIQFNKAAAICITGADFTPAIDHQPVSVHQPIVVNKGALLEFKKVKSGARCYLAVLQDLHLQEWLGSFSTNIKAKAGGLDGRALKNGDVIDFNDLEGTAGYLKGKNMKVLPWFVLPNSATATGKLEVIEAKEWGWLTEESKQLFIRNSFTISNVADRMGYRLKGNKLEIKKQKQLVSSGVSFGTIQLLPNGQLIILLADHQTTGGYPRIANITSAHLPTIAQMKPNDPLFFSVTDVHSAEQKLIQQHNYLLSVQYASSFKMKHLFP